MMKRRLSTFLSRVIIGTALGLIGALGFTSCKARATRGAAKEDRTERPDTATLVKPRPRPDDMGMVMYGTPTTTFEPKRIVDPQETEAK